MRSGTVVVVGGISLALLLAGKKLDQQNLPKGISAWSYHLDKKLGAKVKEHNKKAKPQTKFTYFFPYAGSLEFKKGSRTASISYNAQKTSAYARALPKGVLLMPIVDARDDKKAFCGWSDKEYADLAEKVAEQIVKDRHAAGAQVDVEPFNPSHLPFYKHLKEALNKKGKVLTMFAGIRKGAVMKQIFDACDIFVFSGYDGSGQNPGPEKYKASLTRKVARLQKLAHAVGGKYMVGIPAAASWGEYEYVIDKHGEKTVTGHKQAEYVKASIEVLKEYDGKPEYIGMSLWVMSHVATKDDPKAKGNQPNFVRPEVWDLLEKY